MKKAASMSITLIIAILILISAAFYVKEVKAQNTDYTIDLVNYEVEVMYNGYILINNTIKINGTPNSFLLGFPYKYGLHVLRCIAYEPSDPAQRYPVTPGVPLENRVGFYGVEIDFPQGAPQVFTVVFILSNNLVNVTQERYTLDFPAYPSLTKPVANCSVSIALPEDANDVVITKDDGTTNETAYSRELPAFAYSPATLTFSLTGGKIQIFEAKEMRREIRITGIGEIECSDSYYIKSISSEKIDFVTIILPSNASNPIAQDQFGRQMQLEKLQVDEKANFYKVTLLLPLESHNSVTRFAVKYYLPSEIYIKQEESNTFSFISPLFQNLNYYIEQVSITLVLPEGAKISSEIPLATWHYSITGDVFQETVTIDKQGVFSLDNFEIEITYNYNPLWLSFRPTLWIWALATVGCAIAIAWKRPKAPVPVTMPKVTERLSPKLIKSFVDTYEEKRKLTLEVKSLEIGLRKGRIPRRRYKVRRKTLETRLYALSKDLDDLRQKLRTVGGRYADLMHQLEVVETEINEVEADIKSIEARHRRGELSLEAYRKLLSDYERRKEKAETTINGILIRLREEIH